MYFKFEYSHWNFFREIKSTNIIKCQKKQHFRPEKIQKFCLTLMLCDSGYISNLIQIKIGTDLKGKYCPVCFGE